MKSLRSVLITIYHLFSRVIGAVIGKVSWRPPGWAMALQSGVVHRPGLSIFSILFVILLVSAGGWIWNWYAHQPKPSTVGWIISLADFPNPSDEFQPQDLTLTFGESVAKLESIGKTVASGISLSPPLKGKWTWSGGT